MSDKDSLSFRTSDELKFPAAEGTEESLAGRTGEAVNEAVDTLIPGNGSRPATEPPSAGGPNDADGYAGVDAEPGESPLRDPAGVSCAPGGETGPDYLTETPVEEPAAEAPTLRIPDFVLNSIQVDAERMRAGVAPLDVETVLARQSNTSPMSKAASGVGGVPETESGTEDGEQAGGGADEPSVAADEAMGERPDSRQTEYPGACREDGGNSGAPGPGGRADAEGAETAGVEAADSGGEGTGPMGAGGTGRQDGPGAEKVEAPAEGELEVLEAPREAGPVFSLEDSTSVFHFAGEVSTFCFSRLGDWGQAKEATAETMTHVLRTDVWDHSNRDVQRKRILEIAREVCLDLLRRTALIQGGGSPITSTPVPAGQAAKPDTPPAISPPTLEDLEAGSVAERSRLAVASLLEPQRSIVKMRLWNGASFARIARCIGKTEQSVASLHRVALKTLDKRLKGDFSSATPLPLTPETPGPFVASEVNHSASHDEALLGPESAALEKQLTKRLPRPEGKAGNEVLVGVARRVLAATTTIEASLRYLFGPMDILPAHQRLHGLARLKGESGTARQAGERIFGGEIVMTGGDTTALVALRSGHELLLGPGSAMVVGSMGEGDPAFLSVSLLQGRAVCVPGAQVTATLTVNFPGGSAQSFYDCFQVVVLSLASTRVETVDGTPVVSNKAARQSPGRNQAVMCRGGTNPAISPARREAAFLNWAEPVMKSASFPSDTRDRVNAILAPPPPPPVKGKGASSAGVEVSGSIGGERRRKRQRMIVIGAAVAVVAVAAALFMLRERSGAGVFADWFDAATYQRRMGYGLPGRSLNEAPAGFALRTTMASHMVLSPPRIPLIANTDLMMAPSYLTLEGFQQARSQALLALQAEPDWPDQSEALVKVFVGRLKDRSPKGLDLITPGFPPPFWGYIVKTMDDISSFEIMPFYWPIADPSVSLFRVRLNHAQSSMVYELVVIRERESGGRPYIDPLASRWSGVGAE